MARVQYGLWGLCALCLLVTEFYTEWVKPVRSLGYYYAQALYHAVSFPQHGLLRVASFFQNQTMLQRTNEQLRFTVLEQRVLLNQLNSILADNQALRGLSHQMQTNTVQGRLAKVVDMSQDKLTQNLLLNQGSRGGVSPGHMVVDVQGMVGVVLEVFPTFSKVALITDPSLGIPAVAVRSGFRTIVHGTGSPAALTLLHVPNTADLVMGDRLETSDLGSHFKAGYPIGEITHIEKDSSEAFMKVTVKPIAKLYQSNHVFILDQDHPDVEARKDAS